MRTTVQRNNLRNLAEGARAGLGQWLVVVISATTLLTASGCSRAERLFDRVDRSKALMAETQVKMLHGALKSYRLDVGSYPSTAEGLSALMAAPADTVDYWQGPYLEDELPFDPWGQAYQYESPAENEYGIAIYSLGADGRRGGEGFDADLGYLPDAPRP